MQLGQPAFVDEVERTRKHVFALRRKTGDDVRAEGNIRAQLPHLFAECDGVATGMSPLHALEDNVIAGLQRQMQMRHQPRTIGERIEQISIDFHGVN